MFNCGAVACVYIRSFAEGCFAVDVMMLMVYLCGWCCYWWLAGCVWLAYV